MAVYADCDACDGQIIVGLFSPIRVPAIDADGFPIMNKQGELQTVVLQLPVHRVALPISVMDPTGLAPSGCRHGLEHHPIPEFDGNKWANSYVRAKYLKLEKSVGGIPVPVCPVCLGQPRPEDMTTSRAQLA